MPIVTERFVDSAWRRGCDAIILDLEDSVPEDLKTHARSLFKNSIPKVIRGGAEVFVRINHELMEDDVEATVWPPLARLLFPKAEHSSEIVVLDELITRLEAERGIERGSIEIDAMVESALSVSNAIEIVAASERITSFGTSGGYDMSLDFGIEMFMPFDQFFYQRGETELAARVHGVEPTGLIFMPDQSGSVSDPEHARAFYVASRKAGFHSSIALHPAVVESQNEGFTPTDEEVAEAHLVLQRFAELEQTSDSWREIDGRIIDHYEAARATELIEWATRCSDRDAEKEAAAVSAIQEIERSG
jgi:citrate lyase subunit beta / citryl-CoA lyase